MNTSMNTSRGQAMIISVIFFLAASMVFVVGVISPILLEIDRAENLVSSKSSFYAAESGVEDVSYRLKRGIAVSTTESLTINSATVSTTISTVAGGQLVASAGNQGGLLRNAAVTLNNGVGVTFFYGVQVGAGGVSVNNNAAIYGSLYSNGPITGWAVTVNGDVVSAGNSGSINGVNSTGSAYAKTIQNSTIGGNAYYQSISGSSVAGTLYPGSAVQPLIDMPIADAQLDSWEAAAATGNTITSCNYSSGTITAGPTVFNCDLNLNNDATLVLTGPVWVKGNLNVSNNAIIRVSSTLGNQSAVIIVDKTTNRTSASTINLANNTVYQGSGHANSYILLVSRNTSASTGGGNTAISVSNNAAGALILYAPYGQIQLSNNTDIREVTGYKLSISNNVEVNYQTGLANLLFSSGAGGGYTIGNWKESQ